jgi:MFS family permease
MALFFVLSVYSELKGPGLIFGFILGIVLVLPIPSYSALTQDMVTPERKGIAFGMNTSSMYLLGGGWAPIVIGYVPDVLGRGVQGLKGALMIAGCGGLLVSAALLIASRTYLEDMEKVKGYVLHVEN